MAVCTNYRVSKPFWEGLLPKVNLKSTPLIRFYAYLKDNLSRSCHKAVISDPSLFGLKYAPMTFPSRDGLHLQGWGFTTDKKSPVVILLHGIRANRGEPAQRVFSIARELTQHGYNVLAFDFRAHGESEGDRISAGYYEKLDLLGAVDYLRKQGYTGKIGVLGFSMGAAISLMGAAECKEISAVIADSSFIDVVSIIKWKLSRWGFLSSLVIPPLMVMVKMILSIDFRKIKPLEAIKSLSIPVFIIHGARDNVIPVEHAYRLRSACKNRLNQLWVVPEASHTDAFAYRTEEYLRRVLTFFNKAFSLA